MRKLSIRRLLNMTPVDGCLLMFHANHQQVRSRCSEIALLSCNVVDDPPRYQEDLVITQGRLVPVYRDLYVTVKP